MLPHDTEDRIAPLAFAIVNARVWTGDERRPWADAVLVRGDRIVAVGSSAELRKRGAAATTVVDAGGRLVVPLTSTGRLAPDEPADLGIVDRVADPGAESSSAQEDFIFIVEHGRLILDRDGLAAQWR
jgi:hypothetical protein